jgi:AcrR family transcriptional regulator
MPNKSNQGTGAAKPPQAKARVKEKPGLARRRGRPTKAEGKKLHEHLLKVAAKEFLKNGFSRATVDAIALRSRVGKMTIYRHYPTKERIFRAVVQRIYERFSNDFENIPQENRPVEDVLSDFILASYDDPASEDILGITRIIIAEAQSFPDLAYTIYAQRRDMLRPLTNYLTRMRAEGVLQFDWAPELLAFQLVAMASGGVRALMVPADSIERGREFWTKAALSLFLNGCLKR